MHVRPQKGVENFQSLVRYSGETELRANKVVPTNEFETAVDRAPGAVSSGELFPEPMNAHTMFRLVDEGVYVRRPGHSGTMKLISKESAKSDPVLGPRMALFGI